MSEKIYACLLRLFPSAFRQRYEQEALQLLRDRLRDERGFLPRLRLAISLTADIARALPQVYGNSYAEVATSSSLADRFQGAPSFQALQTEPIRPVVIAMAGLLSLTALAIFTIVMGRPTPHRPTALNEPSSPIESVIERLNQTTSAASVDGVGVDAAQTTPANAGQPLSKGAVSESATRAPNKPSIQESSKTRNASHAPSPATAATSLPTQDQPPAVQIVPQSDVPPNMRASISPNLPTNFPAGWTGAFRAVGGDANFPQWFIFKQDAAKLTGIGEMGSGDRHPVLHGFVARNTVKFELNDGKREFVYDLRAEGNELQGTVSVRSTNEQRTIDIRLEQTR